MNAQICYVNSILFVLLTLKIENLIIKPLEITKTRHEFQNTNVCRPKMKRWQGLVSLEML